MSRSPTVSRALKKRIDGITAQLTGRETSASLKRYADQARAQRDWPRDAYLRRKICEMEPERVGAWVQYGHALKEAGFHARAADAYRRALESKPGDAEITLQLAHLAKVRGDFAEARRCFEAARDAGHPMADHIDFELRLLRRIDNSQVFWGVSPAAPKVPLRIFLSAPAKPVNEIDRDAASAGLGLADYSYAFAMRGFIDALQEMELDFTVIQRPENIADIRDRSGAEINIHLGFYPPERIRVLKGAYNINCFAWEFDRLRSPEEAYSHHAFADQATMLNIVDEIWVPSTHGAEAVRASVTKPVSRVPSPVLTDLARRPRNQAPTSRDIQRAARDLAAVNWEPLAILPRIQNTLDGAARARSGSIQSVLGRCGIEEPLIFLSVFSVHDYRKQIEPMVEGFLRFAERNPRALLLLKMTTPWKGHANRHLMEEQIGDPGRMLRPLASERVWLTDATLSRAEMDRLYDLSAFYVCTSHAEGQNLPLLEAMGRGVVPVSTVHTAMSDYLSDNDAVVIESRPRPFDIRLSRRYGMTGLATNFVEAQDVEDALVRAADLSSADYSHRSAAAHAEVRSQFGLEPFAATFENLIKRVRNGGEA